MTTTYEIRDEATDEAAGQAPGVNAYDALNTFNNDALKGAGRLTVGGDDRRVYLHHDGDTYHAVAIMDDDVDPAAEIAEASATAYMADDYGPDEFRKVAAFLLAQGHSAREAEAILQSKHMRWADDSEGHGDGRPTNAAAFKRYYRAGHHDWLAEGRELAAATFGEADPLDDEPRVTGAPPPDDELDLRLTLGDAADLVEALTVFDGIDEGENTDSDRLRALADLIRRQVPGGQDALDTAGAGIVKGAEA